MNFSSTFYKVAINILILSFVANLYGVVTFPIDFIYLSAIYIFFAAGILLHDNLLKFLTVRKAFITRLLAIAIIAGLLFLFYDTTIPGFLIDGYRVDPKRFEFITIESYTLDKYVTIVLLGLTTGFVSSLLMWLEGTVE